MQENRQREQQNRSRNHRQPRGPHVATPAAAPGFTTSHILGGALLLGSAVGIGSVATSAEGRAAILAQVKPVGVATGLMRERAPQQGDWWPGCNPVREAGSAPLYYGEPGYRAEMDGDGDGVACEPY